MKKFVRIIDENGLFIKDEFVDKLTKFTIETPCPNGFYRPKWNGEKWVECASDEYIKSLQQPQIPTLEKRIEALENIELERILNNG